MLFLGSFSNVEARFKICAENLRTGKRLSILGEATGRELLTGLVGTKDERSGPFETLSSPFKPF